MVTSRYMVKNEDGLKMMNIRRALRAIKNNNHLHTHTLIQGYAFGNNLGFSITAMNTAGVRNQTNDDCSTC